MSDGAFIIPALVSPGFLIAQLVLALPALLPRPTSGTGPAETDMEARVDLVITIASVLAFALFTLILALLVVGSWQRVGLELETAGVRWRSPFYRRLVPWEALAAGGPPRPAIDAPQLRLAVGRPELVVQRGWTSKLVGTTRNPVVDLRVDVHPWFVADAIRCYAEHPEHRAAIGTETEHERLVAELTASPQPSVPRGHSAPQDS